MKKLALAIACTAMLVLGGHAFATAPSTGTDAQSAAAESAQLTKNLVFHGTVEKIDEGTALNTDRGVYPLLGGDFDMIVGKEVNIIGKMVKEGNTEKIAVSRVQFDKQ